MPLDRRELMARAVAALGTVSLSPFASAAGQQPASLHREIGITMSSVARLETAAGPEDISILDWPRILRDELDMRVIDLNTGAVTSTEPAYLEKVRSAADKAGCVLTNMKINRDDVNIGHRDKAVRDKALAECKRWIEASSHLGVRWARPIPSVEQPDMPGYLAAFRELADYAAEHKVQLLVENYGWMDADADASTRLIEAVGHNIAACPDTGNWANQETRFAGLTKMFPRAVSCDFKAGKLGPHGEHAAWDLKRCFTIGWDAGFRGPWCLEHANTDRKALIRELALLRDMLKMWMAERG